MYSERLLDHFRHPRSVGELDAPAVTAEVSNPACGDIFRITARIEAGVVCEARYRARGCTASIATGSAVAEWINGRGLAEIEAVSVMEVEALVGGLPPESKHAAHLCRDGLRLLVQSARRA